MSPPPARGGVLRGAPETASRQGHPCPCRTRSSVQTEEANGSLESSIQRGESCTFSWLTASPLAPRLSRLRVPEGERPLALRSCPARRPLPRRRPRSVVLREAWGGEGRAALPTDWLAVPCTLNLVAFPQAPPTLPRDQRSTSRCPCRGGKGPARQMRHILTLLSSRNFSAFAMLFSRKMRWDEDLYSWS